MKKKWFSDLQCAVSGLVLCISTFVSASPIARIEIFDAADNQLLFVTFDYNDKGICIKRNVFASDSTFMYSTTPQPKSATGPTKEVSLDFNNNPLYTTTVNAPSNGTTAFSTVDQFGLSQYGAPLGYTEGTPNTFNVTQSGARLCSQQYEYNPDGQLSRITIFDKNGNKAWYASVSTPGVAVRKLAKPLPLHLLRVNVNQGVVRLQCSMAAEQFISAELLTPHGRKVLSLVHKNIPKGNHNFTTPTGSFLASGVYIVRVTINGTPALTRRIIAQK
jgi:hypothetical protein